MADGTGFLEKRGKATKIFLYPNTYGVELITNTLPHGKGCTVVQQYSRYNTLMKSFGHHYKYYK